MGFDSKTLSEILGHSSVKITMDIYVHSSIKQNAEVHGKAELLAVRIMVKAGRKSAFIRVSGLLVAYGNDKRLFFTLKKSTRQTSLRGCLPYFISLLYFYVIKLSVLKPHIH